MATFNELSIFEKKVFVLLITIEGILTEYWFIQADVRFTRMIGYLDIG